MYKEHKQEMSPSDESSDIHPSEGEWDNQTLNDTFKSAESEIAEAKLFTNIHANLLRPPRNDGKEIEAVFGKGQNEVIFDSVIIPLELENREIELTRMNKVLIEQISGLYKIKKQKQNELIEAQAKIKSVEKSSQSIDDLVKVNPSLVSLKQTVKPKEWLTNSEKNTKQRDEVLNLAENELERKEKALRLEIEDLKNRKEDLRKREKELEESIRHMDVETSEKKHEKRQQLVDEHVMKENKEIANLKISIQKIEKLIEREAQRQTHF